MQISQFIEWIEMNNIKQRSINGFWNYLDSYKKEEQEEYNQFIKGKNPSAFEIQIKQISLTISYEFDNAVNLVSSDVSIKDKEEEIGQYTAVYTTDGDDFDDYLKLY
jgi:predicted transcriptional regulator